MTVLWQELRLLICNCLLTLIIEIAPKNHEEGILLIVAIRAYVKNCLARKEMVK